MASLACMCAWPCRLQAVTQQQQPCLCPTVAGDAAAAAEGAESHALAGQLVASVACMPRSLLIFK